MNKYMLVISFLLGLYGSNLHARVTEYYMPLFKCERINKVPKCKMVAVPDNGGEQ